jgi:hypothetical protein
MSEPEDIQLQVNEALKDIKPVDVRILVRAIELMGKVAREKKVGDKFQSVIFRSHVEACREAGQDEVPTFMHAAARFYGFINTLEFPEVAAWITRDPETKAFLIHIDLVKACSGAPMVDDRLDFLPADLLKVLGDRPRTIEEIEAQDAEIDWLGSEENREPPEARSDEPDPGVL